MISITPIHYRLGYSLQDGELNSLDLEGMLSGV